MGILRWKSLTGIDGIETEFVDKLQDDGFGPCIVARNGQGNSTRRSTRPTAFEQMARIDVINGHSLGLLPNGLE